MRRGRKPTKSKEAKPLVGRKSPKDDGSGLGDVEKRLAEALRDTAQALKREAEAREQQTATSEILRVIRESPTDLQPVAQAIADSASRLCDCAYVGVFRFDGELIHWVAARGVTTEQEDALRSVWTRPPGHNTLTGRTIVGCVKEIVSFEATDYSTLSS